MKKTFGFCMLSVLLACTAFSAQAGGYDYDKKHEIAISFGAMSNSNWIDLYEDITVAGLVEFGDDSFMGPLSVEYFYHPKSWLGVGGIFVYGNKSQDFSFRGENVKAGEFSNSYLTLMPSVKLDWLRKKNFGMYSKLGLGATLRMEHTDYDKATDEDRNDNTVHVNYQISLLGLEAGSPTVRGFVELGIGEQGIGQIGLRYKF
ncbi:MAG: hypothetical protein K5683_04515 [Prevotella sp.]|nr:hypothetical protein [Prevotella sp.]